MKTLTYRQHLGIIERLCLMAENGSQDFKNYKSILDDVYCIAHLNGSCENEHSDWHKKGFALIKTMKKHGLTDIDKDIKDTSNG